MGPTEHKKLELKTAAEIEAIREAGQILHAVIEEVAAQVRPGITPIDLDRIAKGLILEAGAKPAFENLYGFPKTLCTAINDAVVHGIPRKVDLQEGDVISIDCGVKYNGFFADMATTVAVGEVRTEVARLMEVTKKSLYLGIEQCWPGKRLGDIGHAIQTFVEGEGFHVIEGYGGHGLGRNPHEDPHIENKGQPGKGKRLKTGMVLAIEPMIAIGTGQTVTLDDNWTVLTADGSIAAHYEHTVAVTEQGPRILTLPQEALVEMGLSR
ncbi:MAG: type I methionyl aminopeptidase [Sumerlaeia bacterium]